MALDINNASVEEIAALPGVGMELAETIVEFRDERGGFSSLDELRDIPRCDEQMVMRLREAGVNLGAAIETEGSAETGSGSL